MVLVRLEETVQDQAKDYGQVHLLPRGDLAFQDPNLRGRVRFAERRGNFLPTLTPRNSTTLVEDAVLRSRQVVLESLPAGFDLESIISIGPGLELGRIVDLDDATGTVVLESETFAAHSEGTGVTLYGVPARVIGPWAKGADTIQLRSPHPVVPGDGIGVETTPGLLNSAVTSRVVTALSLGTTLDGLENYQVVLDPPVSRALENDEEVFLRGYPGYLSETNRLVVDEPFLVDHLSGRFYDTVEVEEQLSIQLFDSVGDPLVGYDSPVAVLKNHPVVSMRVPADRMLFWDVIAGSVWWRDGRFVARTDQEGRFAISYPVVPGWPAGNEWLVSALADGPGVLRVRFAPNGFREAVVFPGVLTRLTIGMDGADQPGDRVEVVVKAQAGGTEVVLGDWLPTSPSPTSLRYGLVVRAEGQAVWQSSSLLLKRYMVGLDSLESRYNQTGYNQGNLWV